MVKKKNSLFIIIVISVVLLISIVALLQNNIPFQEFAGGSILSVSQINYLTKDNDLGTKSYLVNLVADGGGEKLKTTITSDTIKSYGIKELPPGNFEIEIELSNVSCDYKIKNDDTSFYKLYYTSVGNGCLARPPPYNNVDLESTKAACINGAWNDPNAIAPNKRVQGSAPKKNGNCNAMVYINEFAYWAPEEQYSIRDGYGIGECTDGFSDGGIKGDWHVTNIGGVPFYKGYLIGTEIIPKYILKIKITNDTGESQEIELDSSTKNTDFNKFIKAKVIGNLVGSEFCPIPATEYAVVKDISDNGISTPSVFKTVKALDYNSYKSQLAEVIGLDIDHYTFTFIQQIDPAIGGDSVFMYMSNLNLALLHMFNQNISNNCIIKGEELKNDNQLTYSCKPTTLPFLPQLQLIINADWLGVYIPSGNPEILSFTLDDIIYDGEFTIIKTDVINKGEDDSFDGYLQCNNVKHISVRFSLLQNEKKTIGIPFYATQGLKSCELIIQSVNDASKIFKKSVTINVKESLIINELIKEQQLTKQALIEKIDQINKNVQLEQQKLQLLQDLYKNQSISLEEVTKQKAYLETITKQSSVQLDNAKAEFNNVIQEQSKTYIGFQSEINKQLDIFKNDLEKIEGNNSNEAIKLKSELNLKINNLETQTVQLEDLKKKDQYFNDALISQIKDLQDFKFQITQQQQQTSYILYSIIAFLSIGIFYLIIKRKRR